MNIQPLGGASPAVTSIGASTPTTMASPPPAPALNGTLAGIARQLGMEVGDVQSALKAGQSITTLADQQGVSRDSLMRSVRDQVHNAAQAGGQAAPDPAAVDRMINRAFDRRLRRP
jgi:hypothetical protein